MLTPRDHIHALIHTNITLVHNSSAQAHYTHTNTRHSYTTTPTATQAHPHKHHTPYTHTSTPHTHTHHTHAHQTHHTLIPQTQIHMPNLAPLPGANKANTSPHNWFCKLSDFFLLTIYLFHVLTPFGHLKFWSNFTSVCFLKVSYIGSPTPNHEAGELVWQGPEDTHSLAAWLPRCRRCRRRQCRHRRCRAASLTESVVLWCSAGRGTPPRGASLAANGGHPYAFFLWAYFRVDMLH